MSYNNAVSAAIRLAKRTKSEVAVVRDGDEYDIFTEEQFETFHFGARPLLWADAEGNLTACL